MYSTREITGAGIVTSSLNLRERVMIDDSSAATTTMMSSTRANIRAAL
jgi:hypothetical protein